MATYMIITAEGYTFGPHCEEPEPDVENCQVLGFAEGADMEDAVRRFREECPWVRRLGFREVVVYEVGRGGRFELGD